MSARKKPDEGRYSKVSRRIWGSADFRALSAPKPNAQTLWFRLLTGPELGMIPGLFEMSEAGLAERMGWPIAAFRKCLTEITSKSMATFDRGAGLMWVPKAIHHNPPDNPNVVLGWRAPWRELPDCATKDLARVHLYEWCSQRGSQWVTELAKVMGNVGGNPLPPEGPKGCRNPSGNQEKEQEKEQEQEQENEEATAPTLPQKPFAMHRDWQLDPDVRGTLETDLIPGYAIDEIVGRAKSHYAAQKSDKRTDQAWNQAVAKWVRGDFHDPKKRPRKPEEQQATGTEDLTWR